MKDKKLALKIGLISGFSLTFIALMIVATFYDLQINIALQNPNSFFGQFFAYLGETPAYIAAPIAATIFFQAVTKENKFYWVLKVATALLCFAGYFVFFMYFTGKLFSENLMYETAYIIIFSAFAVPLTLLATAKVDKEIMQKLVIFAIFLLVFLGLSQGLTTLFKFFGGRLRFRNMNSNYDGFTRWYQFQFGSSGREHLAQGEKLDDAFKSFPSGHTSAAGLSFALIMVPSLFDKLKKHAVWFYVIPAVYTIMVAISRMVAKAHFLSDVLVGGLISVLSAFFLRWLCLFVYDKIRKRPLNE